MIWYEYKYITIKEIIDNLTKLSDFWSQELIILWSFMVFIFILLYYIIPAVKIIHKYNLDKKKSIKKKLFVKQIIMQKELEDEIEKELEEYNIWWA